jgi:multidrug resistance efflux pump
MNNQGSKKMKTQKLIHIPAFVLILLLLQTGCGSTSAKETPTLTPVSSGPGVAVVAEGRLMPRDNTNLYVAAPGKVDQVFVTEGEAVTQGTVLLRLGDREGYLANLAAAQAQVTSAQQALDQLHRTATLAYNQALLDEAAAQAAYNAALKAWDSFDHDQYEKDLDQAKADVATALSELKDAQKEFAKYVDREKDNPDRIRTKAALDAAQTKYDNAVIHQTEVENRFIQVNSNLEVAKGRLAEATRIRQQRANGPDADQLALAQANLDAAQAGVTAAQAALDHLDVVAPYDGVVARIDISVGETASPSQPVIVFADLNHWFVETTDLTEKEVVNIRVGQSVTVVPDALPTLTLSGTVERIGLTYTEKSGDIVYPVRIRLDPTDAALLWGMTVEVSFLQK